MDWQIWSFAFRLSTLYPHNGPVKRPQYYKRLNNPPIHLMLPSHPILRLGQQSLLIIFQLLFIGEKAPLSMKLLPIYLEFGIGF